METNSSASGRVSSTQSPRRLRGVSSRCRPERSIHSKTGFKSNIHKNNNKSSKNNNNLQKNEMIQIEYIPDPPIEAQFKDVGRLFAKIKNFFSFFSSEDKNNNSDSNSDTSSIISDSAIREERPIQQLLLDFTGAIQKLFIDLNKIFISSLKKVNASSASNDENDNNKIPSIIEEQLLNLEALIMNLRKLQLSVVHKSISNYQSVTIEFTTVFPDLNICIDQCNQTYIEEVWNICSSAIAEKNYPFYYKFRPFLISRLRNAEEEISKLNIDIVTAIHDVSYVPTNGETKQKGEEEEEEDIEYRTNELQSNVIENVGNLMGKLMLNGYQKIFPILKNFWIVDPTTNRKSTNEEEDPITDEEKADNKKRLFLPIDLFSHRFENYNILFSIQKKLMGNLNNHKKENEEEDNGAEEEEEEEEFFEVDPLVPFIKAHLSDGYNDLTEAIKVFWALSHRMRRNDVFAEFGTTLVNVYKTRVQDGDDTLKTVAIAQLFRLSVTIDDRKTTSELIKILMHVINNKIKELGKLRNDEIVFISSYVPQCFYSENDEEVDEESAKEIISRLKEKYGKEKFDTIKESATQISTSLLICQESIFLYHRNISATSPNLTSPSNNPNNANNSTNNSNAVSKENQENEEDEANMAAFSKFDLKFNETTHDHLANLSKYLNEIYANVLINQSPVKDGSFASPSSKASSRSNAIGIDDDRRSVASSTARKAAKSKTTRRKVEHSLNNDERLQVHFVEEAIVRTYEELFSSIRSLITVAIRNLDADSAEKMNKDLRNMNTEYLGHLEELRRACVNEMDINGTKMVEERMVSNQENTNQIIIKCLEESLSDVIEQTLENYMTNLQAIEDDFQVQEEISQKDLNKRSFQLEKHEHMAAIVFLEKQQKIELLHEEQRPIASLNNRQLLVKQLLNAKDFAGAEIEKKKLEEETAKERERRKKTVLTKYEKLKKQKMAQQYRDLGNLENSFKAKNERYKQEKERKLEEQKNMLTSSIRASQQRIFLFGTRLLQNDPKIRKNLSTKFDKIVQNTLKERNMPDILKTKK